MAKIAVLLIVVLVTGLVVAPLPARAQVAADYGGYGPPIGPLALIITNGSLVSCYEIFARQTGNGYFALSGRAMKVNSQLLNQGQAVIGFAFGNGDEVVFGIEAFPTAAAQIAAKIGGAFLLSTLLGTGFGYHLFPAQIIAFSFLFRLGLGPC